MCNKSFAVFSFATGNPEMLNIFLNVFVDQPSTLIHLTFVDSLYYFVYDPSLILNLILLEILCAFWAAPHTLFI